MARINAAKNFAGQSYATTNYVNTQITGVQNQITGVQNQITGVQNQIKIDGSAVADSIGSAVYNILDIKKVDDGQDTYKIKASVLPELAITRTFTYEIQEEGNIDDIVANAIGNQRVQSGDVVIITSTDATKADEFAGAYIFTDNADKDSAQYGLNFTKIYVQDGRVTTVNGVAPVGGNVILNLYDDLGYVAPTLESLGYVPYSLPATVVKSNLENVQLTIDESAKTVKIGSLDAFKPEEVNALRTEVGASTDALSGKSIYTRLAAVEASLGIGGEDGNDGIAEQLAAEIAARKEDDALLLTGLNAEIAARKADDAQIVSETNAIFAKIETNEGTLKSSIESVDAQRKADFDVLSTYTGYVDSSVSDFSTQVNDNFNAITTEFENISGVNIGGLLTVVSFQVTATATAENHEFTRTYTVQDLNGMFHEKLTYRNARCVGLLSVYNKSDNTMIYPEVAFNAGGLTFTADYDGIEENITETWTVYILVAYSPIFGTSDIAYSGVAFADSASDATIGTLNAVDDIGALTNASTPAAVTLKNQ